MTAENLTYTEPGSTPPLKDATAEASPRVRSFRMPARLPVKFGSTVLAPVIPGLASLPPTEKPTRRSLTSPGRVSRGTWTRAETPRLPLAPPCLSVTDYVGMSLGILLIFAITLINGRGRIFWEDETLGWVLLRDPSWLHMLRAWKLGADGGGIFFYVLGRAWFRVFGDGVLAFRLFTATTFGLAFPVLWATLRRFYSTGIVAFAVFNTLFFSPPLTMHYVEGRFYGLLMLGTALALYATVALDGLQGPVPRRWYGFTFGAHLLLTGSHVLGVVYSAFLVFALIVLDDIRGRRRPSLYAAASCSWLLLLLERTAMEATARVGKPHFWTKAPNLGQVIGAYSVFSPEILMVLLLLLLCTIATLPPDTARLRATLLNRVQARLGIYVAGGCVLLVPIGLLLEGLIGTWLFTDRYLQPVALGVSCFTAELALCTTRELRSGVFKKQWPKLSTFAASGLAATFAVALLFWVFRHEAEYTPSVPDYTAQLTERLPKGVPVVVEDAFTFTELMSRPAGALRPYIFLLDWRYALSSEAPRMEVTQYHLMQNWKTAGYFGSNIQDRDKFLREHSEFLVVSNSILGKDPSQRPEKGNPIAAHLLVTPEYAMQRILTLDRVYRDSQRDTVWLVRRKTAPGALIQDSSMPEQYCVLSANGIQCR